VLKGAVHFATFPDTVSLSLTRTRICKNAPNVLITATILFLLVDVNGIHALYEGPLCCFEQLSFRQERHACDHIATSALWLKVFRAAVSGIRAKQLEFPEPIQEVVEMHYNNVISSICVISRAVYFFSAVYSVR